MEIRYCCCQFRIKYIVWCLPAGQRRVDPPVRAGAFTPAADGRHRQRETDSHINRCRPLSRICHVSLPGLLRHNTLHWSVSECTMGTACFIKQLRTLLTLRFSGDFRYSSSMLRKPCLYTSIEVLYLDNTNCDPNRDLPTRRRATQQIKEIIRSHPDYTIIIGERGSVTLCMLGLGEVIP